MLNYFKQKKQIKELKSKIDQIHSENRQSIQELKGLRLTAEQDIERVNEAGRRLYPERYESRVIDQYINTEVRNNLIDDYATD